MPEVELELFKPGEYPQGTYTDAEVQEIVDSYDPKLHEAPLVVGHKTNEERARSGEPAHGWFQRLFAKDGKLYGVMPSVSDFAQDAMTTTHKKWSIELYPRGRLKEAGGKLYLKAVALLGAAAPQVKGLRAAAFNDEFGESITIFQEEKPMPEGITKDDLDSGFTKLLNGFKDLFKGKKFADDDDPDADDPISVDELIDNLDNDGIGDLLDGLAANERVSQIAAAREQEAEETRMSELEADPNFRFRRDHQKADLKAWADKMVKEKKIGPKAMDLGLLNFMEMLADSVGGEELATKFSEKGDAMLPLQFLQKFVETNIVAPEGEKGGVQEGEGDKGGKDNPAGINMAEHDDKGTKIEFGQLDLAAQAVKLAEEKKIPIDVAMIRVAQMQKS